MSDQITRGFHFTMLSDSVIDDERVGKHELLVYTVLCRYAGKERTAFPSIPTISRKARLSERTVQEAIKGLQALGYLHVERRKRDDGTNGNKSNLYTVTDTPGAMVAPPSRNDCTTPGAVVAPEVDTLEVDTRKEGENGTPKGVAVENETATPSFHERVVEALNKHASGTKLSATTCKAIDEFAEKNGEKALNAVVKSYVDEKTPEKIKKYVNKDLIERFADYIPPAPERATCNKCGQYVEVEGICTDCADAERTRVEDEKHRIEHPEEYESVACSECGDNHMRMSLTNGLCFTCRQDAKIAQ